MLDDLIESRRGAWEGRTYAELAAEDPALLAAFEAGERTFAFPGGESLEEQIARTRRALDAIAAGPQPALAVAHAGTIRAALRTRRAARCRASASCRTGSCSGWAELPRGRFTRSG